MTQETTNMPESLFRRAAVPVANRDDAAATTAGLRLYIAGMESTAIAVHVIEKAGGASNKPSVEQLELRTDEIFSIVTDGLSDTGVALETDLRYGTDIAPTIVDAAHDRSANAIVFTPRGGSRWRKLLTGDVTHNLVRSSDIPILVLPDREEGET